MDFRGGNSSIGINSDRYQAKIVDSNSSNISDLLENNVDDASDNFFNSLIDNISSGIIRVSYDGDNAEVIFVSKKAHELVGKSKCEFIYTKKYKKGLFLPYGENESEYLDNYLNLGIHPTREIKAVNEENSVKWLQIKCYMVSKSKGQAVFQYIITDITNLKNTIFTLKGEKDCLDIITQLSTDSLFEYNILTKIMYLSSSKNSILGANRNINNFQKYFINHEYVHPDFYDKFNDFCIELNNGAEEIAYELMLKVPEDEYQWFRLDGRTLYTSEKVPYRVIGQIKNIHEEKEKETRLKENINLDSLTRLLNQESTRKEIISWIDNNSSINKGVLFIIDIDNFKSINDNHGHLFGDAVLCSLADELKTIFGEKDILGRVGGDEFVIYMVDGNRDSAMEMASIVKKTIRGVFSGSSDNNAITCSIGMAEYKNEYKSYEDLFKRADTALDFAKKMGKDYYEMFEGYYKYGVIDGDNNFSARYLYEKNRTQKMSNTLHPIVVFSLELLEKSSNRRNALKMVFDRLSRFFKLDCIVLSEKDSESSMKLLYKWYSYGNVPDDSKLFPYSCEQWNKYIENYDENGIGRFLIDNNSEENANNKSSFLSSLVYDGNKIIGAVSFGHCCENKKWSEDEVNVLKELASILLICCKEILNKKAENLKNEQMINYDKLTGLPNFSHFKFLCEEELYKRYNKDYYIIYADFANFKFINEKYGYVSGDKVLKSFAKDILKDESQIVVASRINADKFLLLVTVNNLNNGINVIVDRSRKFCDKANKQFPISNLLLKSGICKVDIDNKNAISAAIDNANIAKKTIELISETDCVVFTEKLREKYNMEMELSVSMVNALENKEFVVYIQPKVTLEGETIDGAEALVRWQKQDGTIIPPDDFIPLFEKNGFVTKIDFFVFEQVMELQSRRIKENKSTIPISVNFSRRHQENPHFFEDILTIINKYKVPMNLIEIELTESVFSSNTKQIKNFLKELRELGLDVSIDDFGSGYSSLNVLSSVPANIVKLDKVFLEEGNSERNKDVIKYLVLMVKRLGYKIVAEGVETIEQVQLLRDVKCDMAQGYYFSKPIPLLEFERKIG